MARKMQCFDRKDRDATLSSYQDEGWDLTFGDRVIVDHKRVSKVHKNMFRTH
jgi:hypothetical protein